MRAYLKNSLVAQRQHFQYEDKMLRARHATLVRIGHPDTDSHQALINLNAKFLDLVEAELAAMPETV